MKRGRGALVVVGLVVAVRRGRSARRRQGGRCGRERPLAWLQGVACGLPLSRESGNACRADRRAARSGSATSGHARRGAALAAHGVGRTSRAPSAAGCRPADPSSWPTPDRGCPPATTRSSALWASTRSSREDVLRSIPFAGGASPATNGPSGESAMAERACAWQPPSGSPVRPRERRCSCERRAAPRPPSRIPWGEAGSSSCPPMPCPTVASARPTTWRCSRAFGPWPPPGSSTSSITVSRPPPQPDSRTLATSLRPLHAPPRLPLRTRGPRRRAPVRSSLDGAARDRRLHRFVPSRARDDAPAPRPPSAGRRSPPRSCPGARSTHSPPREQRVTDEKSLLDLAGRVAHAQSHSRRNG